MNHCRAWHDVKKRTCFANLVLKFKGGMSFTKPASWSLGGVSRNRRNYFQNSLRIVYKYEFNHFQLQAI